MIKITFLGTGTSQGIPVIGSDHPVSFSKDLKDKRLRSSILIENENLHFTIDCGPDFRQQMLRAYCKKLDAIVGVESRGFLFGYSLAMKLQIPFVPARKGGKLPGSVVQTKYSLEYGQATLEIHKNDIVEVISNFEQQKIKI